MVKRRVAYAIEHGWGNCETEKGMVKRDVHETHHLKLRREYRNPISDIPVESSLFETVKSLLLLMCVCICVGLVFIAVPAFLL